MPNLESVKMHNLSSRFLNGLKSYNLSQEDIAGWNYCGGTKKGRHLAYFKMRFPNHELPALSEECICGHPIKQNCYITNNEDILVLGNCCIKRFIPKCGRTCSECGGGHKNRKDNKCHSCRNKDRKDSSKCGRKCSECGSGHRNRKDNKCHLCRNKECEESSNYNRAIHSIISFGKYKGQKTFQEISQINKPYLEFLMNKGFFSNDQYRQNKYIRMLIT